MPWPADLSLIYVPYYARLLHMLGFILSPKNYANFCYNPRGLFLINFFFNDLQLQIIESISPKSSLENSSAQWAIFL